MSTITLYIAIHIGACWNI